MRMKPIGSNTCRRARLLSRSAPGTGLAAILVLSVSATPSMALSNMELGEPATLPLSVERLSLGHLEKVRQPSTGSRRLGRIQIADRGDDELPWGESWTRSLKPRVREAATRTIIAEPGSIKPMLAADSVQSMKRAIAHYELVVNEGGWPKVSTKRPLMKGARGREVLLLRRRLEISGDLSSAKSAEPSKFDSGLEAAVRSFQKRYGLKTDGVVGGKTLQELNEPASTRLATLKINMRRVERLSAELGDKYVVVNIPGAQIETVENGFVYSRHNAVVGMKARPTPIVASSIRELNFNPYWHVPQSIVRKDLLPALRKDRGLLARMNMRVYRGGYNGKEVDPKSIDWSTVRPGQFLFRQDPGTFNAMASVKINFPNSHAVFLHDTPTKNLFGLAERYLSSGCVRVQGVDIMLEWLLKSHKDWNEDRIHSTAASGKRLDVRLNKQIPLRIAYLTGWATSDGKVHFRNDLYGWDEKYGGEEPIDVKTPRPAHDKIAHGSPRASNEERLALKQQHGPHGKPDDGEPTQEVFAADEDAEPLERYR